jgi:protein phosphatase
MKARYYSLTDTGKKRSLNEDAFLNSERFALFMVADGMGGHQYGDVASKMALSSILAFLETRAGDRNTFSRQTLVDAISLANRSIFRMKSVDASIEKMGCTLVCFAPGESGAGLAFHAGDSRLYRFRAETLRAVTRDHSVERNLPDFMQGLGGGRFSSMLSRALGSNESVEIEITAVDFRKGDIFLLCSDGLYSMLDHDVLSSILKSSGSLRSTCESLVRQANRAGGEDNITLTLVRIDSLEEPERFEMTRD